MVPTPLIYLSQGDEIKKKIRNLVGGSSAPPNLNLTNPLGVVSWYEMSQKVNFKVK